MNTQLEIADIFAYPTIAKMTQYVHKLITKRMATPARDAKTAHMTQKLTPDAKTDSPPAPKLAPLCAVFPGQGVQCAGMAASAAKSVHAMRIFDEASRIMGYDVLVRCNEGPYDDMRSTQVMVFTACVAAFAHHSAQGALALPQFCAGLSLGEWAALVCAGAIDFADALELVRRRADLMAECAKSTPGEMLSVQGLKLDELARYFYSLTSYEYFHKILV